MIKNLGYFTKKIVSKSDFDATVKKYNQALDVFVKGDHEPLKDLYSHQHDVTLANPFGPPVQGWLAVARTLERAAQHYREGYAAGFDQIAKYATPALGYIVEIERYEAKVGGSVEMTPVSIRVTTIFRLEDGNWRVIHRHADPITTTQLPESVIQKQG